MTDQTYAQLSCYLVDDDPSITELVTLLLQKKGHVVASNTSSIKALPEIIAQRPQLVILDIMMPEIDGFMVLKNLKEDVDTKDIPVIMLTNLGQEEDIEKGKRLGAIDYLVKANLTPGQVVAKVKEVLNKPTA